MSNRKYLAELILPFIEDDSETLINFALSNKEFLNVYKSKYPKIEISCQGCREDQPNQLAHMARGGCLYDPVISAIWGLD